MPRDYIQDYLESGGCKLRGDIMSYLDPNGANKDKCPLCDELLEDDDEYLADFVLEDEQGNIYTELGRVCMSCDETIKDHSKLSSIEDINKDFMDELVANERFRDYLSTGKLPINTQSRAFWDAGLTVFSLREVASLEHDNVGLVYSPVCGKLSNDYGYADMDYGMPFFCEKKYEPYVNKHWIHHDHCVMCSNDYPIDNYELDARRKSDTVGQHLCPSCYVAHGLHNKPERFFPVTCSSCKKSYFIDRSLDPNFNFSDNVLRKKPCRSCYSKTEPIEIYYAEDLKAIFEIKNGKITYAILVKDEHSQSLGVAATVEEWVCWKTSVESFTDIYQAVLSAEVEANS